MVAPPQKKNTYVSDNNSGIKSVSHTVWPVDFDIDIDIYVYIYSHSLVYI